MIEFVLYLLAFVGFFAIKIALLNWITK